MPRVVDSRWALPMLLAVAAIIAGLAVALLAPGTRAVSPSADADETYRAFRVYVDGEPVVYVEDAATLDHALQRAVERESLARGHPLSITSEVTARPVRLRERPLTVEGGPLVGALVPALRFGSRGVAVVVDGEPVVALASEREARAAVQRVLDRYTTRLREGGFAAPGGGRIDEGVRVDEIGIAEQVRYEQVEQPRRALRDAGTAAAILTRGTDRIVLHEVQRGESMWTIAHANDMTVDELRQANPEVDNPERLQIGQELSLIVPDPYLTVESTETRTYQKRIPFPTRVERDPELWPWERYVKQAGTYGRRRVVERVARVNGEIVDVRVLENEVLSQPGVQVVVRGSKVVPDMGTGVFRWPLDGGELTDRFGYSRWRGRRHDGIDLATDRGASVYAADTGVVTLARWYGALGRTIMVDHGGGKRVTVYGHLSSMQAAVGQKVQKGDVIGGVGSSGFSTGPHLHFEVRINDRPVNPLNYFKSGN